MLRKSEARSGMFGFRGRRRRRVERVRVHALIEEAVSEAQALAELVLLVGAKAASNRNELRVIASRRNDGVLAVLARLAHEELSADVRYAVVVLRDALEALGDALERRVAPTPRVGSSERASARKGQLPAALEEMLYAARFLAIVAGQP